MSNVKIEKVSVLTSQCLPTDFNSKCDCTNGGISSKKSRLCVAYGSDDAWDADADLVLCDGSGGGTRVINDEADLLSVIGRGGYVKLTTKGRDSLCGPMDGGNWAVNTNGLGIIKVPVHIHDRFETWDQYESLSR